MISLKLLAAAGVLAVVALPGCSSAAPPGTPGVSGTSASSSATPSAPATGSGTPATGTHDQADIAFASMMIPHHRQAIAMSDMLLAKPGVDAKVTDLATRIKTAQTPEIAQMSGWLAGWGQDPSPSAMDGMQGMDHGDGMMTQAEMDALDQAPGDAAVTLFLSGMVKHHQGAVAMAQTELDQGQNPDAKKLAQAIIAAQQVEITEMNQLLGR